MKWIGNHISYKHHDDYLTIIISGKTDSWKVNLILLWLIAWLCIGFSMLYYSFFSNIFDGQRWYAITFIAFWAYFLYRITRVYLWRKHGMEYVKIDADKFSYKRSIFGYGKANEFLSKNIKKIQLEDFDNKSFSKTYNESFWILGGGVIKITSIDNQLNLGSQLNSVDASKLIKIISTYTNKIKSRT